VDHLILDEAELTLPSFLDDLKNGHPKNLPGIRFCDLHHTPIPAWGLMRMRNYASMSIQFPGGARSTAISAM